MGASGDFGPDVDGRRGVSFSPLMQRQKRLTKKERKAAERASAPVGRDGHHHHGHIHCTSCGRHLDEEEFDTGVAVVVACAHGTPFSSCAACAPRTKALLDEHDRTGQPVKQAAAWH